MSCTCQGCGSKFKVDVLISDDLWEKIKPKGKSEGNGLLCGCCIFKRIESLNEYAALYFTKTYNKTDDTFKFFRHIVNEIIQNNYTITQLRHMYENLPKHVKDSAFDSNQKVFENVVYEYLLKHQEIIINSISP